MIVVMVVKVVTHNTGRRPTIHSVIDSTFFTKQDLARNPCSRHPGQSLKIDLQK